ncbi:hypothetical protein CPAST_c26160 [Clostridium pasteurianum DSM 525 = ATCC 6013]|uniref:Lipoprotein n=1 Tax=Clostridium pasteurianum DSM 525 = ATCC 6013 TaxID=1262449 RepID=A0A0H3J5D9_CLOPA|nr:DUF4883 family protein [Clostridium pasteurianum]AJA48684.1 hypothetical protein CPAST_c26160 [Clostridium pasteurianum DSM 525 = ATCC 6013]AJA52672.1 hypothetical protein CLPA_c26160 [Clostridium pasteurianum DSM 525 = ATCC 6013]AOZ75910.1 hypothetical protein AQ983_12710 [Clostridium pasteurianum DSM 525 = ATCC 6013]AOZ79706.1 hypothetical protein AQ984_12705 [Clostridium pasteurianum]ELP59983.1 hypothetical protein F502_05087 [Clostridium pasteurianum DSM 525 = ATCC 6013]
MKVNKLIYIGIIIVLTLSITGCSLDANSTSLLKRQKPYNFYYTNLLTRDMKFENSFLGIILDTNFYREHTLTKDQNDTVKNFIFYLSRKDFISKPKDLPGKPTYKIYFTFKTDKYVIEVFNEKYISVYPWDGSYNKDYISMENIPVSYNLFSLCKYSIPRD